MKPVTNAFSVLLVPFLGSAKDNLHDHAYLPGLERVRDDLISIVDAFEIRREEISSNLDLVPAAKARMIEEAREAALAKVDALEDLARQEQRLRVKIFATGPEKSEIMQLLNFLRLQEVRQSLGHLDSLQLMARLEKALANGEDWVIDAVTAAPFPMVEKKFLDDLLERRAFSRLETENPALLQEFEDVKLINGLVKGMKNVSRQHFRQ